MCVCVKGQYYVKQKGNLVCMLFFFLDLLLSKTPVNLKESWVSRIKKLLNYHCNKNVTLPFSSYAPLSILHFQAIPSSWRCGLHSFMKYVYTYLPCRTHQGQTTFLVKEWSLTSKIKMYFFASPSDFLLHRTLSCWSIIVHWPL